LGQSGIIIAEGKTRINQHLMDKDSMRSRLTGSSIGRTPAVEEQLAKAGSRLAAVLNRALAD
jgi:hypothetical protein